MLAEIIMSALPKLNGARNPSVATTTAYDDLRSKVAALVRPEKTVASVLQPAVTPSMLRPSLEEATPVLPLKADVQAKFRDPASVFDILTRATSCFELLSQKIDQVEGERDEALSQIEDHKRATAGWQEMIETIQARMQDAERDLAEMRQELATHQGRASKAEARAAELDSALRQRDHRLSEVEKQYASLYDQVMNSFGLGSSTQRVLESLVQRFHAKAA